MRHGAAGVLAGHERRGGLRRRAAGELPGGLGQRDLRPAAAHQLAADRRRGRSCASTTRCSGVPGARLEDDPPGAVALAGPGAVRGVPGVACGSSRSRCTTPPAPRGMIARGGEPEEPRSPASRPARELGLTVLAERIQTEKENFTKFAVIGTERPRARAADKTSLVMAVLDEPGLAARRRSSRSPSGHQPAQARVAAPARQAVRVRDVRRRDGAAMDDPALEDALHEVAAAHLDGARARDVSGRRPIPSRRNATDPATPPGYDAAHGSRPARVTTSSVWAAGALAAIACWAPWASPSQALPTGPPSRPRPRQRPPDQQVAGITTFRGERARRWYGEGPVPSDPVSAGSIRTTARRCARCPRRAARGRDQAMVRDRLDRPAQRRTA